MRQIVELIHAKVQHVCGAAILHRVQLLLSVFLQGIRRDEMGHGMCEVSIDDHAVRINLFSVFEFHTANFSTIEDELFHPGAGVNFGSAVFRSASHRSRNFTKSPLGVEDAVLVLHVGEHGEGSRTLPGRHAEILALERKKQSKLFIRKILLQVVVDSVAKGKVGQSRKKVWRKRFRRTGKIVLKSW